MYGTEPEDAIDKHSMVEEAAVSDATSNHMNAVEQTMAPDALGTTGRRRALSVASAQPSVETVIVKAKRAASSLWMLLHAQVRTRDSRGSSFFLLAHFVDGRPSIWAN